MTIFRKTTCALLFSVVVFTTLSAHIEPNSDKERIERLLNVLQDKTQLINAGEMIRNASQALHLSREIGYRRGMLKSYYVIAQAYFYEGNYEQSLVWLSKIESEAEAAKYRHYTTMMYHLRGEIYRDIELTEMAKRDFAKALETSGKIRNANYKHLIRSRINISFAQMFANSHQTDSLNHYLREAEICLSSIGADFPHNISFEYLMLKGEQHLRNNETDSAKYYFDLAMVQTLTHKYVNRAQLYMRIGELYKMTNRTDSALIFFQMAKAHVNSTGITQDLPLAYKSLSDYYGHVGDIDSARYYLGWKLDAENKHSAKVIAGSREIIKSVLSENSQRGNAALSRNMFFVSSAVAFAAAMVLYLLWQKRGRSIVSPLSAQIDERRVESASTHDEVINLARSNSPAFMTRFAEVYPKFWNKLIKAHPDLTPAEQHLCAMTFLKFSTRDISEIACLQIRSVQTIRSRLRKKISLDSELDLQQYLNSL